MANQEHVAILKQGVETWNQWRQRHIDTKPDLSNADLTDVDLIGVDLSSATLNNATLNNACLYRADLSYASLRNADLSSAFLIGADLSYTSFRNNAVLSAASLRNAILTGADLTDAELDGADLSQATLVETNLERTVLTNCHIYGIAAWNVKLKGASQESLLITPEAEPRIYVDNLEVAQFIYLLLNNPKIREVIDTIVKKAVLILGRFTPERKVVLDAIRQALRARGYLPILFDFDKPASRDITETISILAHLSRFVIADITDAKSIPQELMSVVPNLPSVPVQPLILTSQHEYGMFEHFTRFPWVLPVYRYTDEEELLQSLQEKVVAPAECKAQELERR